MKRAFEQGGGHSRAVADCVAMPAIAQAPPELSNPQLEIAYVAPRNSALEPVRERLQAEKRRVLEQLKQFLAPLSLPRKLTVQFDQCGGPARAYKSPGPLPSATS